MRGFASWTRVPVVTTTNARKGDPKGDADERKMEVRGERGSETGRVGPTRKKRKKKGNSTKMEGWPKKKDERGRRTPTSIPRRWNFLFLFFLFFFKNSSERCYFDFTTIFDATKQERELEEESRKEQPEKENQKIIQGLNETKGKKEKNVPRRYKKCCERIPKRSRETKKTKRKKKEER